MCDLMILELKVVSSHKRVHLSRLKFSSKLLVLVPPLAAPQQVICSISLVLDLPSFVQPHVQILPCFQEL